LETIHYRQLGREDLRVGQGTFQVTLADGRDVTLTEILLPEYAEDAGTTDAYAITVNGIGEPYDTGMVYYFKANTVNTGAATLSVNGGAAKTIKKLVSQDLVDSDILASQLVIYPCFGIHVPFRTNLWIGLWFTLVSLVRSYLVRRFYNWRHR